MGNRFCLLRRKVAVPERLTRPQRLTRQPSNFNYKMLRRFILAGKLAPCYDALDESDPDLEECPICCLYFPSLNRSRCCSKGICTECFLQMKPSRSIARSAECPFCKALFYGVEYRGARTMEEKIIEQLEEQKVIEAKIRMQQDDRCISDHVTLATEACHSVELHAPNQCHGLPEVISKDFELASLEEGQSGDDPSIATRRQRSCHVNAESEIFFSMEHARRFTDHSMDLENHTTRITSRYCEVNTESEMFFSMENDLENHTTRACSW